MIKNFKSILTVILVSCSLLHGMKKNDCVKVVVLSNPNLMPSKTIIYSKYPIISKEKQKNLYEKVINIIGGPIEFLISFKNITEGYFHINGSLNLKINDSQEKKLLAIEGIATIGSMSNFKTNELEKLRKEGDETLSNLFDKGPSKLTKTTDTAVILDNPILARNIKHPVEKHQNRDKKHYIYSKFINVPLKKEEEERLMKEMTNILGWTMDFLKMRIHLPDGFFQLFITDEEKKKLLKIKSIAVIGPMRSSFIANYSKLNDIREAGNKDLRNLFKDL